MVEEDTCDVSAVDTISAPRLLTHEEWEVLGFGDGPWAKYKSASDNYDADIFPTPLPDEADCTEASTLDTLDTTTTTTTTVEVADNVPEIIDPQHEPILAHEVTVSTEQNAAVVQLSDEEKLKRAQEKWAIKMKDFDPATARRVPVLPAVNNGADGCKEDPEALEAVLMGEAKA